MGKFLDCQHLDAARANRRIFIEVPSLTDFPELLHGFTTRFGGVSTGDYEALNLNFNRPDPKSNVLENYGILSRESGVPLSKMVLSYQVHDNRVLPVTREHSGMGITRERSFKNIDGLVTNVTGLMLVTHYADCVPLYFYDPVNKTIGLSHSGWKGTILDIGGETLEVLTGKYGCDPGNIRVAFGPHIKDCCFEVGSDVAEMFTKSFDWANDLMKYKTDGKWVIDLEGIITQNLLKRGVTEENISGCGICTRCNKDLFFSHRGSMGKTGTGAAFMMMRG